MIFFFPLSFLQQSSESAAIYLLSFDVSTTRTSVGDPILKLKLSG